MARWDIAGGRGIFVWGEGDVAAGEGERKGKRAGGGAGSAGGGERGRKGGGYSLMPKPCHCVC